MRLHKRVTALYSPSEIVKGAIGIFHGKKRIFKTRVRKVKTSAGK
jgi:hypothetical protein